MADFIKYSVMPFSFSNNMQSASSSFNVPLVTPGTPASKRRSITGIVYTTSIDFPFSPASTLGLK